MQVDYTKLEALCHKLVTLYTEDEHREMEYAAQVAESMAYDACLYTNHLAALAAASGAMEAVRAVPDTEGNKDLKWAILAAWMVAQVDYQNIVRIEKENVYKYGREQYIRTDILPEAETALASDYAHPYHPASRSVLQ